MGRARFVEGDNLQTKSTLCRERVSKRSETPTSAMALVGVCYEVMLMSTMYVFAMLRMYSPGD